MSRLSPANKWLDRLTDKKRIRRRLKRAKGVVNTTQDTCGFPRLSHHQINRSAIKTVRLATAKHRRLISVPISASQLLARLYRSCSANASAITAAYGFSQPWSRQDPISSKAAFYSCQSGRDRQQSRQAPHMGGPALHGILRRSDDHDQQYLQQRRHVGSLPRHVPNSWRGAVLRNDTYSFLAESIPPTGTWTNRADYQATSYWGFRQIARGTGDTTNIGFLGTVEFFDNVTGADLTTAWFAAIGLPSSTQFGFNYSLEYVAGTEPPSAGGVGIVQDLIDGTGAFGYAPPDPSFFSGIGSSGSITESWTMLGATNPLDSSFPATTGTLTAIQYEYVVSKYADPASTPTADNSSYADITFLKVVGDIYDPPEAGSYPTTTRQISIYYEQGVRVALYSVDAAGSTQGASNQLVDLAMYLFTSFKRQSGWHNA
jgi:hypothetical protein